MPKLFMLLLGATPPGRNIEQHDVFFGIGENIKDLVSSLLAFWPEAKGKLHIDAWREVHYVNGHKVTLVSADDERQGAAKLFFINLGGYKENEFEEFHYKMIVAATDKSEAIALSKTTAFFRHNSGVKGANSHIDDKYGIDVDDIYEIGDILSKEVKDQYRIIVEPVTVPMPEDAIQLGYFKLSSFE